MKPLAALIGLLCMQNQASFTSASGTFRLENFEVRVRFEEGTSALRAEANGRPFRLLMLDRGAELTGRQAVVDARRGQRTDYFVTSATVSGEAVLTVDSALGTDPAPGSGRSRYQVTTNAFGYSGTEAEATLTVPGAFVGTAVLHREGLVTRGGARVARVVDSNVEFRGQSGETRFLLTRGDFDALRTAVVNGPATFRLEQRSVTAGVADPPTDVEGSADRIDLDFTGSERTVTLTGNVVVNGRGEGYSGSAKADKAVIVLGEDGRIRELRMTGNPTETHLVPPPRSGGARPGDGSPPPLAAMARAPERKGNAR